MTGGLRIGHYDWSGGREPVLRFGPDAPRVIVSLPLFEEANRTRAFAVTLLRALAARGIGGLLPDWPGTGESLVRTSEATLGAMREACRGLAEGMFSVAIRSGALIDTTADVRGRWHLSPIEGDDLVRELRRLADPQTGDIAGNEVSAAMIGELAEARVGDARVIRLDSDPRPADRKIAAAPLWRRAEPGNDPALAELLADDIAEWIAACDG